jgi:hypothetical protein
MIPSCRRFSRKRACGRILEYALFLFIVMLPYEPKEWFSGNWFLKRKAAAVSRRIPWIYERTHTLQIDHGSSKLKGAFLDIIEHRDIIE